MGPSLGTFSYIAGIYKVGLRCPNARGLRRRPVSPQLPLSLEVLCTP